MRIFNAGPGFTSPLTEQEVKDFLINDKFIMHIGTIDEHGDPNIHPIWYYYNTSNNNIYVGTAKNSKKYVNILEKHSVYFCIDDPNPPYKGVRGKGIVTILHDIAGNISIEKKIIIKYLGTLDDSLAKLILNATERGEGVILEITPIYFSTWDDGK